MSQKSKKVEKNPALHWFVYEFCGGLTKASFRLQVSSATLYDWLTAGFVRTREKAIEMAKLCNQQVSAADLMDMAEAYQDLAPDPEEAPAPRGKGRAPSAAKLALAAKQASTAQAPASSLQRSRRSPRSRAWTRSKIAVGWR